MSTAAETVFDAIVDPLEPPMPPRATLERAANFGKALLRDEPVRGKIQVTVLGNKIREMV